MNRQDRLSLARARRLDYHQNRPSRKGAKRPATPAEKAAFLQKIIAEMEEREKTTTEAAALELIRKVLGQARAELKALKVKEGADGDS